MNKKIELINSQILELLSVYLNNYEKAITIKEIKKVTDCYISEEYAFCLLLASLFNIDVEKESFIFHNYFLKMVHKLDIHEYKNNQYYKNIKIKNIKYERWELRNTKYDPYEAFVCNDFKYYLDGRVLPQIGFFNETFYYPAVYEDNKLWMSITPNEIETMKSVIDEAKGKILTFGLGMGYFSYMVSLKDNVDKIVIVERDKEIIDLFTNVILVQFPNKDKIEIINSDAFDYIQKVNDDDYNLIFTDLWYDASDGKVLYLKMKQYEKNFTKTIFRYWIEDTIKYYL